MEQTADRILMSCGLGSTLDIGSGEGALVAALLRKGVDAQGVDVSEVLVSRCNQRMPARFTHGSVLSLPFPDESFDTLVSTDCMEYLAHADVPKALQEIHRVARRFVFLRIATTQDRDNHLHLTVEDRAWWETKCFEIGFRKHPAYYRINAYESLSMEGGQIVIPLEKIPANAVALYPLAALKEERDLHMDMSRETGSRSDAHMARYALAAEWVRPGDTVLDCACGLGYGTATLAAVSKGDHFLGVDIGEKAVAYASHNFGERYGIEYRQGDAEDLSFVPDASVDTLVSFETLEHILCFEIFLTTACRVLKPDGRIIVSVPNRWEDETGHDPNPYHHHIFDYAKVRAALETKGFLVEGRYAQSAPGGFKLPEAPRSLERLALSPSEGEKDTEWWIVVASANPLSGTERPYSHPDFSRSEIETDFCVTDFARYYDNPWLYRPLIQMGERLDDSGPLLSLAREVLASFSATSPDYGAALAVIGYRALADRNMTATESDKLLELADNYFAQPKGNPHSLRWKISLSFLSASLALKKGDRREALRYFTTTMEFDPCAFSPLLATKTVAAWFWCGILHLTDGDQEAARRCFSTGVEAGRRALHAPDENAIGNPLEPLTFGFPELAEVADMAGQCANALHHFSDFKRSPGKFWRSVDLRRFGLATWAMNLEAQLKELRVQLESRHTELKELRVQLESRHTELKELRVQLEDRRATAVALWHESSPWARMVNRILEKLFGVRLIRMRVLQRLRLDNE